MYLNNFTGITNITIHENSPKRPAEESSENQTPRPKRIKLDFSTTVPLVSTERTDPLPVITTDLPNLIARAKIAQIASQMDIAKPEVQHFTNHRRLSAQEFIQNYSQYWEEAGDAWSLKSDPSVTVSKSTLVSTIDFAFQTYVTGSKRLIAPISPSVRIALRIGLGDRRLIFITPEILGKGNYGTVHKAVDTFGRVIAVKIPLPSFLKDANHEYKILKAIYGENMETAQPIVGLQPPPLGSICVGTSENPTFYGILSRLSSHNLWEEIAGHTLANKPLIRMIPDRNIPYIGKRYQNVALQLAQGLAYLHSKNFAHQDIKSVNVLIDVKEQSVCLIDYGSAHTMWLKNQSERLWHVHPVHHHTLEADILERKAKFEASDFVSYKQMMASIDVYSLGILFHEFFTKGCFPFSKPNKEGIFPNPQDYELNRKRFQRQHVPDDLIDLTFDMINLQPEKRPSANQVVERLQKVKFIEAQPVDVTSQNKEDIHI